MRSHKEKRRCKYHGVVATTDGVCAVCEAMKRIKNDTRTRIK